MVFESLVTDLLNKYLGQYVQNLDPSQLKIGIWDGKKLITLFIRLRFIALRQYWLFILLVVDRNWKMKGHRHAPSLFIYVRTWPYIQCNLGPFNHCWGKCQ